MVSFLSRLGWKAYTGAGLGGVALLALTYFILGSGGGGQPGFAKLPPVQTADIQPGFVGEQPFGAWKLICSKLDGQQSASFGDSSPTRLCRTNAKMMVKGANQQTFLAAGFNILMVDTMKSPAIMFRLPLGARAASTVGFAIDKNTVFTATLKCSEKECMAQGALPPEALEQMKSGQTLKLIYTVKDKKQVDRKVRVDQILYGFKEAFDAMQNAMAS